MRMGQCNTMGQISQMGQNGPFFQPGAAAGVFVPTMAQPGRPGYSQAQMAQVRAVPRWQPQQAMRAQAPLNAAAAAAASAAYGGMPNAAQAIAQFRASAGLAAANGVRHYAPQVQGQAANQVRPVNMTARPITGGQQPPRSSGGLLAISGMPTGLPRGPQPGQPMGAMGVGSRPASYKYTPDVRNPQQPAPPQMAAAHSRPKFVD
jgi:hypothetical protein